MAFVLLLWVLTLVTGGWAYVQGAPTGVRDPRPRVCLRRPVAVPAWRGPALRLRGGDGGGLTVGTNGARTASAGAAPVPVEGVKGADAGALEGEAAGTAVAERVLDVDEVACPRLTHPALLTPSPHPTYPRPGPSVDARSARRL